MAVKRNLTCTCCGGVAGKWQQHHNQDTGFGLCARCRDWIWGRQAVNGQHTEAQRQEFERTYGKPGVNYEAFPEQKGTQ